MNGMAWTVREDATLRLLYPHESDALLRKVFRRSRSAIYRRAYLLGVRKSPEFIDEELSRLGRQLAGAGMAYRFPKGTIPPNKGRKGYYAPGSERGWFKKGQRNGRAAEHHMPVGATRLVDGYVYIKVAEVLNQPYTVNWKPLHILNWERANGRPLPEGHCLWFRDGDRMNVEPKNLELITRSEGMRRNTVHNLPKELSLAIQLRGALVRQINQRSRPDEKRNR